VYVCVCAHLYEYTTKILDCPMLLPHRLIAPSPDQHLFIMLSSSADDAAVVAAAVVAIVVVVVVVVVFSVLHLKLVLFIVVVVA